MAAYQLCVYLYCGQFVYVPFIHSFFYLLVDSVFFNLFINVRRVTPIGWSHTLFRHVWWNKFAHSLQVCLLSQMGQGPVLVGRLVDGERYFWGCRFSLGQLRSSPTFCLLKFLSTMLIFFFFMSPAWLISSPTVNHSSSQKSLLHTHVCTCLFLCSSALTGGLDKTCAGPLFVKIVEYNAIVQQCFMFLVDPSEMFAMHHKRLVPSQPL